MFSRKTPDVWDQDSYVKNPSQFIMMLLSSCHRVYSVTWCCFYTWLLFELVDLGKICFFSFISPSPLFDTSDYFFYLGTLAGWCSVHYGHLEFMACRFMALSLSGSWHCFEILFDFCSHSFFLLFMATIQTFSITFSSLIHLLFPAVLSGNLSFYFTAKIKAMG